MAIESTLQQTEITGDQDDNLVADLRLEVPDKKAPGYMRRVRRAAKFIEAFQDGELSVEAVDDMLEYMADFITYPTDRAEVIEKLLDLNEEDYMQVLEALSETRDAVNPTNVDS